MTDFRSTVDQIVEELRTALYSATDTYPLRQDILHAQRIFVAGKGRSGLQMRAFAMRLTHLEMPVHVVDDVTTPAITENDLLLIGSGSGRTPSLIQYAEKARALNARLAVITIDEASPIAQYADCVLCLPAPTPKLEDTQLTGSILPMGSLFEQALGLLLDIVVLQLMTDLNVNAKQMFARHANLE